MAAIRVHGSPGHPGLVSLGCKGVMNHRGEASSQDCVCCWFVIALMNIPPSFELGFSQRSFWQTHPGFRFWKGRSDMADPGGLRYPFIDDVRSIGSFSSDDERSYQAKPPRTVAP